MIDRYALEQATNAICAMAVSTDPLSERVKKAFQTHLTRIRSQDLSDGQRVFYQKIAAACAGPMDEDHASTVAHLITELHNKLSRPSWATD